MNVGDIPILGEQKTEEDLIKEKLKMQQMMQALPALVCPKCGEMYFEQVFLLRVQSNTLSGQGQTVFPEATYKCAKIDCGFVLGSEEEVPTNDENPANIVDQEQSEQLPEDEQLPGPKLSLV